MKDSLNFLLLQFARFITSDGRTSSISSKFKETYHQVILTNDVTQFLFKKKTTLIHQGDILEEEGSPKVVKRLGIDEGEKESVIKNSMAADKSSFIGVYIIIYIEILEERFLPISAIMFCFL